VHTHKTKGWVVFVCFITVVCVIRNWTQAPHPFLKYWN
jgi:hypothetical protein